MPSTLLSFENKDLSIQVKGFDKDNEMEFVAHDKIGDREFIYYLSVSEVKSLKKFIDDHLSQLTS